MEIKIPGVGPVAVRSEIQVQYRIGQEDPRRTGRTVWGPVQMALNNFQVALTTKGPDGSAANYTVDMSPAEEQGKPISLPLGLTVRSCRVWGVDRVEKGAEATQVYLHNWPLPTSLPLGGWNEVVAEEPSSLKERLQVRKVPCLEVFF